MEIVHRIERVIALTLIALMALVVASATVEVGYELVVALREPPGLFLGVIMDAATLEPMTLFAMALLVIALAAGYYLVARARVHYE